MPLQKIDETIHLWIEALDRYSMEQLCKQPSQGYWSIGQVYMHLIAATGFFFEQVKECMRSDENADQEPAPAALQMFAAGDFPDRVIKGPPSNNATPQPATIDELRRELLVLKEEAAYLVPLIVSNTRKGRTLHPGLMYFNAAQWMQFAAMHFRHHLRQVQRIERAIAIY